MQRAGSAEALLSDGPQLEVPATAIVMIMLVTFIDTLAGSISTPVMPYYAQAFQVSNANIGWLYGLWSFSSTVFAPVLTRMADKIGRRPVLVMSLVGAGVANLIQGLALFCGDWGFKIFLFGRFFSGVWAAVGATCNVYITDVCPEELRPNYIAKLSTVPFIALLFGPGLGGGMSKLGLNVPVCADGAITLFSSCLVAYYLPETPSFLRVKAAKSQATGQAKQPDSKTPVPRSVYLLGFSQFLGGISFSTLLSMMAIFMLSEYNFDGLRIGFVFMGGSLVMVAVNVWGVAFCKQYFTMAQSIVLGGVANGVGYISFGASSTLPVSLLTLCVAFAGNALRGANTTAYLGSFSDETNRGSIFGISQVFMNTGRMVGPIVATHLSDWYNVGTPFYLAGTLSFTAAAIVLLVDLRHRKQQPAPMQTKLTRRETKFGDQWEDQVGSREDVDALGRFVADLLTKRHYQWVTKRSEIERMLDGLLPELQVSDREAYKLALQNVEGKQY
mmetsp:Transcript_6149/g.18403  ORF Transcript_6149/g.18403 Transcript_6149/m.18403 type:complete len:501 (-) Transcript_6149:139-1641(-)